MNIPQPIFLPPVRRSARREGGFRAALVATAAFLLLPGAASQGAPPSSRRPAITAAPATALPRPRRFMPGERAVYDLRYAAQGHADLRAAPGQPNGFVYDLDITIRGRWAVTTLDRSSTRVRLACRLDDPAVACRVNNCPVGAPQMAELQRDLTRDVFVTLASDGRVQQVAFDPAVSPSSQNVVKTLLALTQFVLPDGQRAVLQGRWQAREAAPNGTYTATYRIEKAGAVTTRIAKKLGGGGTPTAQRDENPSMTPSAVRTTVPRGDFTAGLDARSGALLSLRGSQTEVQTLGGKTVARTQSRVELRLQQKQRLSQAQIALLASAGRASGRVRSSLSGRVLDPRAEDGFHRRILGNETLPHLLDDLAHVEAAASEKDFARLYPKLRAVIFLHPAQACEPLGRRLVAARAGSQTFSLLASALGSVGHPQAQQALANALDARARAGDLPGVVRLIPVLGMVKQPAPVAEQTLLHLAEHANPAVASTARLSLGIVARNLSGGSGGAPKRADRLVAFLLRRLQAARSASEKTQWLQSLGNAGARRALAFIAPYLSSRDPALRGAAAVALRWLEAPDVAARLQQALARDAIAEVRRQAAFALGFQTMSTISCQVQQRAFQSDNDVSVRLAVLDNLWKARDRFPAARGMVQKATTDASEPVRKAARAYLAAG